MPSVIHLVLHMVFRKDFSFPVVYDLYNRSEAFERNIFADDKIILCCDTIITEI